MGVKMVQIKGTFEEVIGLITRYLIADKCYGCPFFITCFNAKFIEGSNQKIYRTCEKLEDVFTEMILEDVFTEMILKKLEVDK